MRTRPAPDGLDRPSGLWWLNPVLVAAALPLGTLLLSAAFTDQDFRRLWRSPKVITDAEFDLMLVGAVLLIAGAAVAMALAPVSRTAVHGWFAPRELRLMRRWSTALFWLTMVGYAAFVVQAARANVTLPELMQAARGAAPAGGPLDERITTLPGISTLTQLGVAYGVLAVILRRCHTDAVLRRRLALGLVVVFGWALIRAIALTERLAILEILVPMMAAACLMGLPGTKQHRRNQVLPLILGPVVVGIFALFEYGRTWAWYSTHGSTNFWRFVLERFAGYYVTAVNNAAMRIQHQERGVLPYDTLEMVWKAPGISQLHVYERLTGLQAYQGYAENLKQYTTVEFNNPSGLGNPFVDYTVGAAWLYLFLMGLAVGLLYVLARRRQPLGVLLYPLAFLTLLEMPRYLWWCQGRSLPPVAALVIIAIIMMWWRGSQTSRRKVSSHDDDHRWGSPLADLGHSRAELRGGRGDDPLHG